MKVDLKTLEDFETSFDFTLEPGEIDLESDAARLKNKVRARGKLRKGIAQIDIEGEIFADVEFGCTRCLQPTETSLELPFRAVFVTPENYSQEKEVEISADDLEVSIFEGSRIDLGELVREQILLNLPTQIFCREDCQGLCQKCGANRNLIDCKCEEKEIDPRWAALKNLK